MGGIADAFVEPVDEHQVSAVLRLLELTGTPHCIIGETSNLLFDSEGLRGVVIRIGSRLSGIEISNREVIVKAGNSVPELARVVGAHGLTGLEHTVGIPGTIGGLVLMNGGSKRKGIGSNVVWVRYVDRNGDIAVVSHQECEFAYRSSSLQLMGGAVVAVRLRLESGDPDRITTEMDEIVASRRSRFPEDQPNCGSTFLSDPAMYATVGPPGKVIEEAGLKGTRIGGAEVSLKHANFINNVGGARSGDVLALLGLVRQTVLARTGFAMDAEARYVAPDARITPAHVEADRRTASADASVNQGQ
ncbi:UDP-N-acetylmuramate dehydrogenase [Microbacterium sp. A204]|uniref:UDP-N-acetylmuramate dehydrogenase n=1 Tax=Microbacterium sp. A204 TaxID=3457321 RepID=UPI003FD61094